MASKTITTLVDDVDGSQADETVQFSIDGTTWEIDLSRQHAAELRDALNHVWHARKVGGRQVRRSSPRADNRAIRKWAQARGISVNPRGRVPADVPADVLDQYRAAGN